MKESKQNKEIVESEIKEIAKQFAEDIKEYVVNGGDINDLDANKIYVNETKDKKQG